MKKILGLDLGTNSIGWALVEINHEKKVVKIIGLGSRILPMDAGEIKDFESSGKIKSPAAQRTEDRGRRRLNERYLLRRDRLHLVLDLLNALPEHYGIEIDFENKKGEKCGQFKENAEPKLAYTPKQKGKKAEFLFKNSFYEMLNDIGSENIKDKKGSRIPYDWTLYYLRQKALSEKISLEELAWVLLSYNQKRGYEKIEALDEFDDLSEKLNEFGITKTIQEVIDTSKIDVVPLVLKVMEVTKSEDKLGTYFNIRLENGYSYKEYSTEQITELNDKIDEVKIVEQFTMLNEEGSDIDETKTIYKIEDIFDLKVSNIIPKDTKDKYVKEYSNGWRVDTNYSDYNKFKKADNEIKEEVFLTRLYNEKGELVKPSKKNDLLNLNISNDPFTEFKLLDPNKASNWKLLKKKTEKEALTFNIEQGYKNSDGSAKNYISPKIYSVLKNDAKIGTRTKIIGGMFQVVERDFYREELNQIIATQKQFHKSLADKKIFEQCVKTLYPKNKNHQESLLKNKNAIQHLLVEDILLYQRPLKSKKSEIANCKHEIRYWKNIEDKNGNLIEEVDKETGEVKIKKEPIYIKAVSVSHPYFQEFRIWDKLHDLKLIQLEKEVDGKLLTNQDITKDYFKSEKEYQELFEELNNRKSLNQGQFLSYCKTKFQIDYKSKNSNYAWNFPEDEEIKGNETRVGFAIRFKRCGFAEYADFLTQEKERELWHYLYSVNYKERITNNNKSAVTFFNNYFKGFDIDNTIKEKIIKDFVNYPKFASNYGAYSERALKKLLPLIRLGEVKQIDPWATEQWYVKWQESLVSRQKEILQKLQEIDFNVKNVDYSKVVNTSVDLQKGEIPFPKGLFNTFQSFKQLEDFKNLNLTQASYLVYGRHSELAQAKYWTSPEDIRNQLHQELKQHSLNNPIAEKVLLEMMQVVADIWDYYGNGEEGFFSKIHLEVGRELKKSAKEKEADNKRMSANRAQNKRIRQMLQEFLENSTYNAIPKNTDHFERLKIVEEGAEHRNNLEKDFFEKNEKLKKENITKKDIEAILKKAHITKEDFEKYKLWVEQGYKSPYTNLMIKLTDLFDGNKYNVDHVFPQSSVTNNSLSNKVVCEMEVNKLKSDQTGRDFVNNPKERKISCEAHKSKENPNGYVEIVNDDVYVSTVKTQFSGKKRDILLSKDIPKGFTNSQMNNARHIARKAMELLSHIVREPGEVEFRSKNVLPVTGMITNELKRAWRLDEVWRELVAPRFIRLNELTQSNLFGDWQVSKNGQKYFDCNLDDSIREKDESYDIKRIDHRHHALDALIVALCTEEHVNYINNINANAKSENYGKQKQIEKYRQTLKRKIMWSKPKKEDPKENNWYYMLPGEIRQTTAENSRIDSVINMNYLYKNYNSFGRNYKKMILTALQDTIVTFKQNLRVINNRVNYYQAEPNTKKKKTQEPKTQKDKKNSDNKYNWGIRRSLGKGTYYSKIDVGERENKQLHTNSEFFYNNRDAISNYELRGQIQKIKEESNSADTFKKNLKEIFKNITVECIAYKIASRFNSELNTTFNREKIKTISDSVGRTKTILLNHLRQFDTVELPFEEAIVYYDALLEKQELEVIVSNEENEFQFGEDLIDYLKVNNYKYKKSDYSKLNVFIDKVVERSFRNEEQFKDKIKEHPEIAFTPEEIEEMNKPENIRKLNEGKNHKPIKKVTTYVGFGNQRALSDSKDSVKAKQYVVSDAGTNIYLLVYELSDKSNISRKNPKRIFKEINLFNIIEYQTEMNTNNLPVEKKIFSDDGEEYNFLFTLTQNDTVKIDSQYGELIYVFNRFTQGDVYFRPVNHASEINKNEVDLKINSRTGKLGGSQVNETTSFDGEQIKNICIKLQVDRLGNILKAL